jgi:hypothetical protein
MSHVAASLIPTVPSGRGGGMGEVFSPTVYEFLVET